MMRAGRCAAWIFFPTNLDLGSPRTAQKFLATGDEQHVSAGGVHVLLMGRGVRGEILGPRDV